MTPAPRFARWWWAGFRSSLAMLPRARTRRSLKLAIRQLLCPIDLWRYYELAAVLDSITASDRALDIGSPKVLAGFVRAAAGSAVICSDIAADALPRSQPGLEFMQCDAMRLPFADASISTLYSVSAIEHIAGTGDSVAMREIARVLAPNGLAVVTVPIVPKYEERWVDADPYGKQARDARGRVFFSRYYDWPALDDRIVCAAELHVRAMHAWQESPAGWYARYCRATARPASLRSIGTKLFDPVWAARCIVPVDGGPSHVTRHGIAAIVFEKRGK
ncbi:MAG: class I SAM-dependent methyltransferase [Candidatus Hydrogenedentes bacterium]|nr:class I SAM-dependent methyltransferase [Candidatus Hydrogenedentota bacterium]